MNMPLNLILGFHHKQCQHFGNKLELFSWLFHQKSEFQDASLVVISFFCDQSMLFINWKSSSGVASAPARDGMNGDRKFHIPNTQQKKHK